MSAAIPGGRSEIERLIAKLRRRAQVETPTEIEKDTYSSPELTWKELEQLSALLCEAADALSALLTAAGSAPVPQDALLHPAHQVFFRAGLIACREYMARFVEAESQSIANSIRANWWPTLGPDFGPPRKLDFAEITHGTFGTPEFRPLTAEEVSSTQEALPIALAFLEAPLADAGAAVPAQAPAPQLRSKVSAEYPNKAVKSPAEDSGTKHPSTEPSEGVPKQIEVCPKCGGQEFMGRPDWRRCQSCFLGGKGDIEPLIYERAARPSRPPQEQA